MGENNMVWGKLGKLSLEVKKRWTENDARYPGFYTETLVVEFRRTDVWRVTDNSNRLLFTTTNEGILKFAEFLSHYSDTPIDVVFLPLSFSK